MQIFNNKIGLIHFIGIGGIGMSGIAEVLINLGFKVSGSDLSEFINKIALKVSHIHISDAAGESQEGLQIGEGSLNFDSILKALSTIPKNTTLLPEIWQGHDNLGEGFKIALNRLYKFGY